MISQEAIQQYLAAIDEAVANSDWSRHFDLSSRLYHETEGRYPYFLGGCYLNGWGVEQNFTWASQLLTAAAQQGDNYNYACYLSAIAFYRLQDFFKAYYWFCEAEKAGVRDGLAYFADSAAGCAMKLWDQVRTEFLQSRVTQGAAQVKHYMGDAISKYMQAAEEAPETMSTILYCGFARVLVLMYNMGTTGMLDMDVVGTDTLHGIFFGGVEAMQKMLDTEAHDETLAHCIAGAHFMEQHDAQLVAEYLRAFLAVMESERDRSPAAFYRARWHMKRIGVMRNYVADAQQVANVFADLDEHYRTAERKYGAYAMNMMRAGQLPDLQKSFLPGRAPAPDSCQHFMAMFWEVYNSAQQPASQGQTGAGGGFFNNFFGG